MSSVNVHPPVEVDVIVQYNNGEEMPESKYKVEANWSDQIMVTLKNMSFEVPMPDILRTIRDIANKKCPEFLPHLDDLERQLSLEYLRGC
jgi:hypothetical protein